MANGQYVTDLSEASLKRQNTLSLYIMMPFVRPGALRSSIHGWMTMGNKDY